MQPISSFLIILPLLLMFSSGCASSADTHSTQNDALNGTSWSLLSGEYEAAALQAYAMATNRMELALFDSTWTAALEQRDQSDYRMLPPAVVLDVDETVLDNGTYQTRLVLGDSTFTLASFQAWIAEENAAEVPGALRFTRWADSMGIAVVYVTNRRSVSEDATRNNLKQLGFPVSDAYDAVLTRGERDEWARGEKVGRRTSVAQQFRILGLFGDNLGDFFDIDGLDLDGRSAAVAKYRHYWGSRWFYFPNPMYGSWEGVIFGNNYALDQEDRRAEKHRLLRERAR